MEGKLTLIVQVVFTAPCKNRLNRTKNGLFYILIVTSGFNPLKCGFIEYSIEELFLRSFVTSA